jgi:hypothetical protein
VASKGQGAGLKPGLYKGEDICVTRSVWLVTIGRFGESVTSRLTLVLAGSPRKRLTRSTLIGYTLHLNEKMLHATSSEKARADTSNDSALYREREDKGSKAAHYWQYTG